MGQVLKKAVEFMSAIPTVIYGFVGIFPSGAFDPGVFFKRVGAVHPVRRDYAGVLITPHHGTFFCPEFFHDPGQSFSKGPQALGATTAQQFFHVVLPGAWSGMLTGLVLSFGRAAGDNADCT